MGARKEIDFVGKSIVDLIIKWPTMVDKMGTAFTRDVAS
jgi:hypothetical protein